MPVCLDFILLYSVRLCDEATSALDSTTEASILNSLKSLSVDRTSIFIAHRLTTAMQCDQVRSRIHSTFWIYSPHIYLFETIRQTCIWISMQVVNVSCFSLVSSILMIPVYFQIIVLENGKVVEQGPHDVLLSKGGRYAELWYQQNSSDAGDSAAVSLEVWLTLYTFPSARETEGKTQS